MRRAFALSLALVLALPAFALAAAGTATVVEITAGDVQKVVWSWTSGTAGEGGTVAAVTSYGLYNGKIIGLTTDPGATAPTDNYDVTITDAQGHDVLLGAGADRDTANTENRVSADLGAVANSTLTLNIAAAGDAKIGTVILWIQ